MKIIGIRKRKKRKIRKEVAENLLGRRRTDHRIRIRAKLQPTRSSKTKTLTMIMSNTCCKIFRITLANWRISDVVHLRPPGHFQSVHIKFNV